MPVIPIGVRKARDEALKELNNVGKELSEEIDNTEFFEGYTLIAPGDLGIPTAQTFVGVLRSMCAKYQINCTFDISAHSLSLPVGERVLAIYQSTVQEDLVFVRQAPDELDVTCDGFILSIQQTLSLLDQLIKVMPQGSSVHVAAYIQA